MKKVLIVVLGEGEKMQEMWRRKLADKVKVIGVCSSKDAIMQFSTNDVAAIAVDTCSKDMIETWSLLALVKTLRAGFAGPIIPISALGCWLQNLLNAGCDNYTCSIESFPQKLLEILGLPQ